MTRDELCPINIYSVRTLPTEWVVLDVRGDYWMVPQARACSEVRLYRGGEHGLDAGSDALPLSALASLEGVKLASPEQVAVVLRSIECRTALTEATERMLEHLSDDDAADVLRQVPDAVDALRRTKLVALLRSSNPQVRSLALQALEHVQGPRASVDPEPPSRGAR